MGDEVGHLWGVCRKVFLRVLYVRMSYEKVCRAGVPLASSTCHGSFIPTCFVLSARSDPIILRVDFGGYAPRRLLRSSRRSGSVRCVCWMTYMCRSCEGPEYELREMMCDCMI